MVKKKKKVPFGKASYLSSDSKIKSKQTADQADDRHVLTAYSFDTLPSSILIKYSPYTLSLSYPPPLLQKKIFAPPTKKTGPIYNVFLVLPA